MQEYRKLLCVNKIRETKRLIENMLIPILSLVVAAAVVGYQIVINFFPIIRKINAFNLRICYLVFGFLILYSFGVCFINVKPAIIIKPASLFFIQEKKIRQIRSVVCCKLKTEKDKTNDINKIYRVNLKGHYIFNHSFSLY